jgi:ABC-type transport system substrate-binding protein
MKKRVFLFTLLLGVALLMLSCSGKDKDTQKAKVLTVAIDNPEAALDLHFHQLSSLMSIYDHVVQTLYTYDKNLAIIPLLAADFPTLSNDGKLYTFTLKEGITFHDGTPLTSADVQFTLQRTFDPSISGAIATAAGSYEMIVGAKELMTGSATGPLKGFTVIDDHTFSIEIEDASAPFIQNFAMSYMGIISKAAYLAGKKEDWGIKTLVGSGPYTFGGYIANDKIIVNANPSYWMGATPAIDRIDFKFFNDENVALLEYEHGNVDVVALPVTRYAHYAAGRYANEIFEDEVLGTYMLIPNLEHEAFSNPLVREAFAYAIDRQELVEQVYQGRLDVQDTYLPAGMPGRNENIQASSYDPVHARELLEEAGYPRGVEIEVIFRTGNDIRRHLWTIIQTQASMANFNLTLIEMEANQYHELNNAGKLALQDAGWIASYPDPDDLLYTIFHSNWSPSSSLHLKDERVDRLLDEAKISSNHEERMAMYAEVERLIVEELRAVYPFANIKNFYLIKPRLRNTVLLNGITQFWNSTLSE